MKALVSVGIAVLLAIPVLGACGDSSDDNQPANGGGVDCNALCALGDSANCPHTNRQYCVAQCNYVLSSFASCSAVPEYVKCVQTKATFSCDGDGGVVTNGCDTEFDNLFNVCMNNQTDSGTADTATQSDAGADGAATDSASSGD